MWIPWPGLLRHVRKNGLHGSHLILLDWSDIEEDKDLAAIQVIQDARDVLDLGVCAQGKGAVFCLVAQDLEDIGRESGFLVSSPDLDNRGFSSASLHDKVGEAGGVLGCCSPIIGEPGSCILIWRCIGKADVFPFPLLLPNKVLEPLVCNL